MMTMTHEATTPITTPTAIPIPVTKNQQITQLYCAFKLIILIIMIAIITIYISIIIVGLFAYHCPVLKTFTLPAQ